MSLIFNKGEGDEAEGLGGRTGRYGRKNVLPI